MYGPVLICLPGVAELPGTAAALLLPLLLLLLLSALWQWPGQRAAAQLLATCPVAHISIDKAAEQHIHIALHRIVEPVHTYQPCCGACAYTPATCVRRCSCCGDCSSA